MSENKKAQIPTTKLPNLEFTSPITGDKIKGQVPKMENPPPPPLPKQD